jgi:DNA-binding transcriptional MerR regulator
VEDGDCGGVIPIAAIPVLLKKILHNRHDKEVPMDDFLHNLRKNTDRNYDKRRQNPQYRGPERRGPREQQHRPFQKRPDSQEMMTEMVPEVKALLTRIEETQKKMTEMTERSAAAQERQADVLETIVTLLQRLMAETPDTVVTSVPVAVAPEAETVSDVNMEEKIVSLAAVDRDEVIDLIIRLRDEGMTYKEIAQRLEDENIPTFSGKGAWHAQTVHKVCRKGV